MKASYYIPIFFLVSLSLQVQAQRSNYFFFQLTPNVQMPLAISESPHQNFKEIPSWGASISIGYNLKIYKALSATFSMDGNWNNYLYTSKGNKIQLTVPGLEGQHTFIHFRGYYATPSLSTSLAYEWSIPEVHYPISISAGYRLMALWDYLHGNTISFFTDNNPLYFSVMEYTSGFRGSLLLSAATPIFTPQSRFSLGVAYNKVFKPIGKGTFYIDNSTKNSSGTADFYGSYVGISVRYAIK